jgi:hypothetical protein
MTGAWDWRVCVMWPFLVVYVALVMLGRAMGDR